MQRTLKRESKVLEIVKREAIEASHREKGEDEESHGAGSEPPRVGAPRRRPAHLPRRRGGRPKRFPSGDRRSRPLARISIAGVGASVARAGQRRSEGGEKAPGRVARARREPSLVRTAPGGIPSSPVDRGGALGSARPFAGAGGVVFLEAARSPSARSGRLTQRLRPTRLVTRTKESNVHASRVVKETKPSLFPFPFAGGRENVGMRSESESKGSALPWREALR